MEHEVNRGLNPSMQTEVYAPTKISFTVKNGDIFAIVKET